MSIPVSARVAIGAGLGAGTVGLFALMQGSTDLGMRSFGSKVGGHVEHDGLAVLAAGGLTALGSHLLLGKQAPTALLLGAAGAGWAIAAGAHLLTPHEVVPSSE
jgi:hypothetical protein